MEQGRGAHLLHVEAVGLGQSNGYLFDPQDVLTQALGELADVVPDLLDCGLGDGHRRLAQLPRKLPAPENVHVQVPDSLASLIAAVDGESVSLIEDAFLAGHVVGHDCHVPGQRGVPGLDLPDRLEVGGRQHEKVNGAWGLMSRMTMTCSSLWSTSAGISPATILQKMQSISYIIISG